MAWHPISPPSRCARLVLPASLLVLASATQGANQPAPAYSVGAAFDEARARFVVFGGYRDGTYDGETWEHDGARWSRVASAGPSARNSPALAYDAKHRLVVLFGGDTRASGPLGDTWTWDGITWKRLDVPGPAARTTHTMTYDASRERIVLFGGVAGGQVLGDTWEWDGVRWEQRATDGPPARSLNGLAYDALRRRVVMFGGMSAFRPGAPPLGDTWEWDGQRWTAFSGAAPSARDHTTMAFDEMRGAVVLHGGGEGAARAESWAFDGRAWTRIATDGPPRMNARLYFAPRARALMLYGGFDAAPSSELWRLRAAAWALANGSP